MHVVCVTTEYPLPGRHEGGLANYLRKAAWGLTDRGHDVTVVVASDVSRLHRDGRIRIRQVPRPSVMVRSMRHFGAVLHQLLLARRLAMEVARVEKRKPVDVVLAPNYSAPGRLVRRYVDVPIVCRVSSYSPLLRAASGSVRSFATHLTDFLEVQQVARAEAAFAPSQLMSDVYERFESIPVRVVRTPVEDLDYQSPKEASQTRRDNGYLTFFGTLNRVKGVDLVSSQLPYLFERYPNIGLVLIGRDDGLPGYAQAMDLIRTRAGAHVDRVRHYAPLPRSRWLPIVAGSIAVLMPSRVDNYPNACLEALSLGVPIIGTYDSSIDEIVEDRRTGFLIRNEDRAELRRAIDEMMNLETNHYEAMRRAARESALSMSEEDRLGELEAVLLEAAGD